MHLTIDRATLTRELALVASAAERKATIPVLSHVRLEARGDRLTLTATDLQCGLIASAPATITQEGVICLPAKRLLDYTRTLAGESVTIKTDDKQYATVTAGRARARIAGMDAASFPELPQAPEPIVTMDARALARQFARVAFAISQEASRFTLNGLLAAFRDGLECVATDGHRLAWAKSDAAANGPARFLVPKYAVTNFAKVADMAEGGAPVALSADDNHLWFAVGPRVVIARKLAGNFPDYERVIPKEYAPSLTAPVDAFRAALDSVKQFGESRAAKGGVDYTAALALKAGEMSISATSVDAGECENTVECEYAGKEIRVGVNPLYVSEFLSAAGGDRVEMCIRDAGSAMEMRPAGDANYRYIVMPKRLN
jgi:DNA polymerase-3 subunit beta